MTRLVYICALLAIGLAEEFENDVAVDQQAQSDPFIDPQIVGGSNADIKNYPYQVQLLMNGGLRCGGSILSKNYVLTAAHCTSGVQVSSLSVRVGSSVLSGGTVVRVSKATQHPSYNSRTTDYDASVLKLASALSYGSGIRSIPLAKSLPPDGTMMTVTGWGKLSENGSGSNRLQAVSVPKVNWNQCAKKYTLTNRMVCAGQGGKDSCSGDSGGPLANSGKLSGIVSFGIGCGRAGYPGVYASVPSMYNWIVSQVVFD